MNQSTRAKIWSILTPHQRKSAITLLGLMIVGMVLETLGVGLVIPVIAIITKENLGEHHPRLQSTLDFLGNPDQATLIAYAMIALVGIYLVKALFLCFLTWCQCRFAFEIQASIAQRLFAIYLRQPYMFHLQRNSATLIQNATQEVNQFAFGAILPRVGLVAESLIMVGLAGLLVVIEPIGAFAVAITLGGATAVFYAATRRKVTSLGVARQFHDRLRLQHLQQGLGGAKDVKLLGREEDFLAQHQTHSEQSALAGQQMQTLTQLPRLWIELLAIIGLAVIVLVMVAQGKAFDAIAQTIGLFAAAVFRMMPSMNRVIAYSQSLRYGLATTNTLCTELKVQTTPPNVAVAAELNWTDIELRDVCFTYEAATAPSLSHLSLTIQRGETVGFVGPSGSGKSTLVDLILGLLPPTAGTVLVGHEDIQLNVRGWQNRIGYVPQSIYLTDDSLRRNIAFGLADNKIDASAVARAVRFAQLEHFVTTLPAGLDTVVGERGIRLSGGQRQRIGIARALYHDPSILVLDEATSALDTQTEQEIMEAVTFLRGTKTILIVAHRMSTIKCCQRVFRLDRGTLLTLSSSGAASAGSVEPL